MSATPHHIFFSTQLASKETDEKNKIEFGASSKPKRHDFPKIDILDQHPLPKT
jgi:hypothetical protein